MSQPAQSPSAVSVFSSDPASKSSASSIARPETSVQGAGILIVDEDESFRLGLETFLTEFVGFEDVHAAANGLEALEILREQPSIEMVTLDYQMPEMDGMTFLERVKEGSFPPLAVVMISGYPADNLAERFKAMSSEKLLTDHFLEKPVDFNDLESVILRSYESLKRRQSDELEKNARASDGDDDSSFEKHFAGGPPTESSDEAAGGGEVRARIDWMSETLNGRLDQIESRVENVSSRMPSMAERFWLGVLKWATLGLLAWGFVRFDFGDKLVGWYDIAKARLEAMSSAGPAMDPLEIETTEGEGEVAPKSAE